MWDLEKSKASKKVLQAIASFEFHKNGVEDVAYYPHNPNIFGSAGDDGYLALWDLRSGIILFLNE